MSQTLFNFPFANTAKSLTLPSQFARMVELVETPDLKSCGLCGRAGSSPAPGTKAKLRHQFRFFFITMYTVYAISSISHKYIYVGLTSDLNARVRRHNNGQERTTKPYAPFQLIYQEKCDNRERARIREKYWKSGSGKEKLRKIRDQFSSDSNIGSQVSYLKCGPACRQAGSSPAPGTKLE